MMVILLLDFLLALTVLINKEGLQRVKKKKEEEELPLTNKKMMIMLVLIMTMNQPSIGILTNAKDLVCWNLTFSSVLLAGTRFHDKIIIIVFEKITFRVTRWCLTVLLFRKDLTSHLTSSTDFAILAILIQSLTFCVVFHTESAVALAISS